MAQRRSDVGTLVKELIGRMEKTKGEKEQLLSVINEMEKEKAEVVTKIQELEEQHRKINTDLQQDYAARKDLQILIDDTETSFGKINESIKTLIHVVSK